MDVLDHYAIVPRREDDAVGNSLGVRQELTEGNGSLLGWHKGVRRKNIEIRGKIVRGSDDIVEAHRKFAKGIGKLAGNMSGDRWRKIVRLIARMPEAVGFVKVRSLFSLIVLMVVIK
ncbi:hypothetical protein BHM03_00013814 [Ensete ventricosum]|nr:hypothetical protein BHM03_00013814 [Ensete ventricosum]